MNATCTKNREEIVEELFARYPVLDACRREIVTAVELLICAFVDGKKLLVCGNGGSAADAEHIVGELVKSFLFKRPVDPQFSEAYMKINGEEIPAWLEGALPAVSLVSQTALSTAFGNDEASVGVFAQQVYAYGLPGDVLLAISTSGNSANVVEAAKVARAQEVKVIGLTGAKQSALSEVSDVCVCVPGEETFQIQELHLPIYHCLCAAAEAALFGEVPSS